MARMDEIHESQRLDMLDARGNYWIHPSASSSGHVEIELPTLPGSPNPTERLHARNFGTHVASKVESSFTRQPYLRSGPCCGPVEVFRHYVAAAKGASLMDKTAIRQMERLAADFEADPNRQFFEETVRPHFNGLTPERRNHE
jgi:hypothetical protein